LPDIVAVTIDEQLQDAPELSILIDANQYVMEY
jgi:hypothetical protein